MNEIIVRDKIPAPLSGSLCGDDDDDGEDVHPFKRRPCPYELWLALDLDGDGEDKGDREIHTAWKSYDRFTLRVSWPASVSHITTTFASSPHAHTQSPNDSSIFIFRSPLGSVWHMRSHVACKKHPAQVALTLHRPPAAPPPSTSAVPSAARTKRLHLVRIRLAQEGVRVPVATRQRGRVDEVEAVPLVVLLEPLVLGVLPASVLPTVVALLGVLGAIACGVLPCVFRMLRGVVHRARTELAELEKEEKKES